VIHDDILGTVGHTPLVRLQRLNTRNGAEIMVKLESCNPSGSIKDRAALAMITEAERDGRLRPHDVIIESTSGNLGRSLALIGAVRGYRVILVVDPKAPRSMIRYAKALGATIEMVDIPDADGGYQRSRIDRVKELMASLPGVSFWPDQYANPANPMTHAVHTAYELLADVPTFDALVAAVSTGGHISGLSSTLKRELPGMTTIAVDAVGSAIFGFPKARYTMRGLGLAWHPGNLDSSLVDRVHLVTDREGIATARLLARLDGLFVGESAGAAVFAALHHAHHHPGSRIVVMAADGGASYADESFDDEWLTNRGIAHCVPTVDLTQLIAAARHPEHPAIPIARPTGVAAHPAA
jgi:cystathionine beta-synthase/cysteine synthase A